MEFIWNVEEQKLKNRNLEYMLGDYSQEEMINAIARYNDNIDILKQIELRNQFLEDAKNGLIKESKQWIDGDRCCNHYNYASLKSWLKKQGVEIEWWQDSYGDLMYLSRKGIGSCWSHSAYCSLDDSEERFERYIEDIFYHTLSNLASKERNWFNANDEWTVENNKYVSRCHYDMGTYTEFGSWNPSGETYCGEDHNKTRKLTLEELKSLNTFFDNLEDKLEKFYEEAFKEFPLDKNNFY